VLPIGPPGGTPEPVVPHLGAAAREHVLQEAAEKLDAGQGDAPHRLSPGVPIAKGDLGFVDLLESTVADGDAEEIPGQVVEDAGAIARGLGVDDPRRRPHRGGDLLEEAGLRDRGAHLGAHEHRQRPDGHEERGMLRGNPPRPIGGEPAGGDDQMHVGVIAQIPGPGVQHGEAPQGRPDVARVGRERLERRRRAPQQGPVDDGLVAEGEGSQRRRQRDGDQIVRTGCQFPPYSAPHVIAQWGPGVFARMGATRFRVIGGHSFSPDRGPGVFA